MVPLFIGGKDVREAISEWLTKWSTKGEWVNAGMGSYLEPEQWVITDYSEGVFDRLGAGIDSNFRAFEQNNGGKPGMVKVVTNPSDTEIISITANKHDQAHGNCGQPEMFEKFIELSNRNRWPKKSETQRQRADFGSW